MKTGVFYREPKTKELKQVTTGNATDDIAFVQNQQLAKTEVNLATSKYPDSAVLCLITF